jgi:hypothetical protein
MEKAQMARDSRKNIHKPLAVSHLRRGDRVSAAANGARMADQIASHCNQRCQRARRISALKRMAHRFQELGESI